MSNLVRQMARRLRMAELRRAGALVLAGSLAACTVVDGPPAPVAVAAAPGSLVPVAAVVAPPPPPPPPLQIVDPPVQPGAAVAVSRDEGEPRPVVFFEQPVRVSPPGTPLVLPPPIPRGERQETLVEAVPSQIVLRGSEQGRLVAFLNTVGRGRFDALHIELRSRNRRAVHALMGAARRAGVNPLKMRAVDVHAAGGAVEVIATRYEATAPVCPSLAIVGPSVNDNDFEPTLGCSSRANLATMVNDPADLLRNDAVVPADGSRATVGIERYRSPSNGQYAQRPDGSGQAPVDPGSGYGYGGPLGGSVLGSGGPVSR